MADVWFARSGTTVQAADVLAAPAHEGLDAGGLLSSAVTSAVTAAATSAAVVAAASTPTTAPAADGAHVSLGHTLLMRKHPDDETGASPLI